MFVQAAGLTCTAVDISKVGLSKAMTCVTCETYESAMQCFFQIGTNMYCTNN